jgi:hypothetical protein
MLLNFGFDSSFETIRDFKLIRKNAREVNSTKAYIKMTRFPVEFSVGVALFSCFLLP